MGQLWPLAVGARDGITPSHRVGLNLLGTRRGAARRRCAAWLCRTGRPATVRGGRPPGPGDGLARAGAIADWCRRCRSTGTNWVLGHRPAGRLGHRPAGLSAHSPRNPGGAGQWQACNWRGAGRDGQHRDARHHLGQARVSAPGSGRAACGRARGAGQPPRGGRQGYRRRADGGGGRVRRPAARGHPGRGCGQPDQGGRGGRRRPGHAGPAAGAVN